MNSSDEVASQIFSVITEAQNIPFFLQHVMSDSKEPDSVLSDISQVIMSRYETVQDPKAKARLEEWLFEIDKLRTKSTEPVESSAPNSSVVAAQPPPAPASPARSLQVDKPPTSPSIANLQPSKPERARSRSRSRARRDRSRSRSRSRRRDRSRSTSPKRSSHNKSSKRKRSRSRSRTRSPARHSRDRDRSRSRDRKRSDAASPAKRSKKSSESDNSPKKSHSTSSSSSSSSSNSNLDNMTLPSPASVTSNALKKVINQITEMRQKKTNSSSSDSRTATVSSPLLEKATALVQQLAAVEQESLRHFHIIRNTVESLKKTVDETKAQNESGVQMIAKAITALESVDSSRLASVEQLLAVLQKHTQKLRDEREALEERDRLLSEKGLLAAHADRSTLAPSAHLFISDIPKGQTKSSLHTMLEAFGQVLNFVLLPKWSMAFATMESTRNAEDVVEFFQMHDGMKVNFLSDKIDQQMVEKLGASLSVSE